MRRRRGPDGRRVMSGVRVEAGERSNVATCGGELFEVRVKVIMGFSAFVNNII